MEGMDQTELARVGEISFRQLIEIVGSCLNKSLIQMDLKEVEKEINMIHQNMQAIAETLQ